MLALNFTDLSRAVILGMELLIAPLVNCSNHKCFLALEWEADYEVLTGLLSSQGARQERLGEMGTIVLQL